MSRPNNIIESVYMSQRLAIRHLGISRGLLYRLRQRHPLYRPVYEQERTLLYLRRQVELIACAIAHPQQADVYLLELRQHLACLNAGVVPRFSASDQSVPTPSPEALACPPVLPGANAARAHATPAQLATRSPASGEPAGLTTGLVHAASDQPESGSEHGAALAVVQRNAGRRRRPSSSIPSISSRSIPCPAEPTPSSASSAPPSSSPSSSAPSQESSQ